jgi:hypothetical protein
MGIESLGAIARPEAMVEAEMGYPGGDILAQRPAHRRGGVGKKHHRHNGTYD